MLERELAILLEGTSDAAFTVDLTGEIRTWNKSAEKLFGYPASFALGKSCDTLVGGRLTPGTAVCREYCDVLECVRTGREITNFDMEVRNSSGQRLWVNVSILVASDRTQRRLAIHFMRDIEKRQRADRIANTVLRMAKRLVEDVREGGNLPPVASLTEQEIKILGLLAIGKPTKEVARDLQISVPTLRNHLNHINQKLHTQSRLEAVIQALMRGII
jgi:PAS domain S-box-containing protein